MHPTVRALVGEASLRLTVLDGGADGALDAEVSWAHSSDLSDPTPFLDPGQVLLTTGTQFAAEGDHHDAYVERLTARGVAALGFGTEVVTAGTPEALVRACATRGLPLFEVPYDVPFIAIARFVADRVAAAEHARDAWALGAMRSISFAALRPEGLDATLAELARQLDLSVLLFDASGAVTHGESEGGPALAASHRSDIGAEAARLLRRGQRSSSTMHLDGTTVTLQTIGRRSELRGALAVVGERDLDASDQTVVTSVVALVGVALEQGRILSRARSAVRSAAVRALLDGRADLAAAVLAELGERVAEGEVIVARVQPGDGTTADSRAANAAVLDAWIDDGRVLIGTPQRIRAAAGALVHDGARIGVSAPTRLPDLPRAHREAGAALAAATAASPVVHAGELGSRGVDWLLERPGSRDIAAAVLRPIAHDAALLASLEAWLEANGQTDPAARRLGVHRHTLRARISTIEQLIGRDLSSFAARTEAWIALRATAED
ncbi:PucR family transcriptional regulator [Labedella populi]|nr:PucR family transcriptional regulator [Labedella populi]